MKTEAVDAGGICTREVIWAQRYLAVDDAARLMREHHVGTVVVVDEKEEGRVVVGVLTDRDIVTSIVAKNLDPGDIRVGDAMSTDLVTARENDSLVDLLAGMSRSGVRRMPVIDARGVLVGLVALDDVLGGIARQLQQVVQAMQSGRQREVRQRS